MNLGVDNPVTRFHHAVVTHAFSDMAGDLYHRELSKQISLFLDPTLPFHGGILPLTDLYCMYNRARGVSLISPDDLVKACRLFQSMNLTYRLRVFDSGLMAVHSHKFDDDFISSRMQTLVGEKPMTSLEIAESEGMSVMLSIEALLVISCPAFLSPTLTQLSERMGKICRAESITFDICYYPNPFLSTT